MHYSTFKEWLTKTESSNESISSSPPPPPPPRKSRHPLPKPIYPGSTQDKANQAYIAAREKAEAEIKKNKADWEGCPFGKS